MAPLANLLQRAVSVYAGANHFFKGCLGRVAEQVSAHLALKTGR